MSYIHDPNHHDLASVPAARSPGDSAYSPYGFRHRPGGSQLAYAGQRFDAVTGCYHLGNGYRAYDPALMRFRAPDSLSPFGKGGLNAYAYCGADPVNRIDPSGHYFSIAGLALRVLGMASNAVTLAYNFLGPAPTDLVGLNASRLSTAGSLLSLGSTAAQAAGVPSAVFGANVGTGVSITATLVRAVNAAVGRGTRPLEQIKRNWKLMTGGLLEPPPAVELLQAVVTVPRHITENSVRDGVSAIRFRGSLKNNRPAAMAPRSRSAPPPTSIRQRT